MKKAKHKLTFYVFYDRKDFVKCCGTAQDLVKEGRFSNVNSVHSAAKHCLERHPNSVVKLVVPKYCRRSVYSNG